MNTKEEIRRAISLTEVISGYTPVRRNKALCPFHPDKNPSLSISENKGLWHCFVCGFGGDIFTFVMKAEGMLFSEAVKIMAHRYGIATPYNSPRQMAEIKQHEDLTQSKILELKKRREVRLAALKDHDNFLGGLWKAVNRSNAEGREVTLELVESFFVELDEEYKKLERRYEDETRNVYRKALLQGSRGGGLSQI